MKKSNCSSMFLSALLITTPAFAESPMFAASPAATTSPTTTTTPTTSTSHAVEVSITGIGPAVDDAAYKTVRQVIGHALANGVIDKFVVYGYGVEGGFSACAEAAPQGQAENLEALIRQLNTIRPNPQTTAYSVNPAASCVIEPIFCTQDAKLCPDGSSVGRLPPSCNFAPCPGTQ